MHRAKKLHQAPDSRPSRAEINHTNWTGTFSPGNDFKMMRTKTRQSAGWPAKLPSGANLVMATGTRSLPWCRGDSMMIFNNSAPRRSPRWPVRGDEIPLRAGTIFEADDGQFNFYAWIPWPTGGDRCSDRFGVRLGRWQLLAVVDARWEFCPAFDIVARGFGSSRVGNLTALIG